jgi:ABC-type branched-subunit amino acid transport system substrate-binding protein
MFRVIAALMALSALVPAWADEGITDTEIRLGMVNAQTGPAAGLGRGMRGGAEAYFRNVNAHGGIHGRQVSLVVADDGYEPDRAVDETLKMIEQHKTFALFGYVGTPTANAVLPIVSEMDVPLVGLFTGAMSLRQPVTPQVFNVRASYDDEAEALVAHFVAHGARRVGVFYQDDGFGLAVLSSAEKALTKRGLAVAAKSTFQRNTLFVKAGLAAMLDAKPDAILMVGPYAPLAAFIKEARAAGLKSRLATVSFVGTDNLVTELGKDGDDVVISQVVPFPADDDLVVTRQCREVLAKYGDEPLGFVNFEGCLTAHVLATALERAGRALNRASLVSALNSMHGVDVGGLVATLSPERHQAFDKVFMTQIRGGKIAKLPQ